MIYLLHRNKLTNNKILISKVATIFQEMSLKMKQRKQNKIEIKRKNTNFSILNNQNTLNILKM